MYYSCSGQVTKLIGFERPKKVVDLTTKKIVVSTLEEAAISCLTEEKVNSLTLQLFERKFVY